MDTGSSLRVGRILLVTLTVLSAMSVSSASAQGRAQNAPPGVPVETAGTGRQRVVVDGKTNPELVNHELLIAQIIGSMSIPASPSAADELRLHLHATSIGFGREDEKVLRTEMIRLHALLAPIQARVRASFQGAPIADLQASREARLKSYERLLELLSKDGRDKLNDFIEKQKANTKVIVPANQPRD
jgi:hypothetical protein